MICHMTNENKVYNRQVSSFKLPFTVHIAQKHIRHQLIRTTSKREINLVYNKNKTNYCLNKLSNK